MSTGITNDSLISLNKSASENKEWVNHYVYIKKMLIKGWWKKKCKLTGLKRNNSSARMFKWQFANWRHRDYILLRQIETYARTTCIEKLSTICMLLNQVRLFAIPQKCDNFETINGVYIWMPVCQLTNTTKINEIFSPI